MKPSIRQNYSQEEALQKIQRLFKEQTVEPSEKHVTTIVGLMTFYNVYLPKIITETIKEITEGWQLVIKSICRETGYSFDDFPIQKNLKEQLKQKFPEDCKGCNDRKSLWVEKFAKVKKEVDLAKQNIAKITILA